MTCYLIFVVNQRGMSRLCSFRRALDLFVLLLHGQVMSGTVTLLSKISLRIAANSKTSYARSMGSKKMAPI